MRLKGSYPGTWTLNDLALGCYCRKYHKCANLQNKYPAGLSVANLQRNKPKCFRLSGFNSISLKTRKFMKILMAFHRHNFSLFFDIN